MPETKPVPDDFPGIVPYLTISDAAKALDFYRDAFGATEVMRLAMPDGRIGHAQMKIGDGMFMLADAFPEMGVEGPREGVVSPVSIHLYVPDVDAFFARAEKAGAKIVRPPKDQFHGDRSGRLTDPFGHAWNVATRIRNVRDEDLQQLLNEACEQNE